MKSRTRRRCLRGRHAATALALACATQASTAGTPLTLSGAGPTYTLNVTMALREASQSPVLADLRVRNAAGETMAFAWAAPRTPSGPPQRLPATLYKVPAAPVRSASAPATAEETAQAWIVDTRDSDADLDRLELTLERGTQGVYTLRIEASDDLQHWRTLQEAAQVVQLQALPTVGSTAPLATQAERERLSAIGIELGGVPARYLRLSTAPRSAIAPLLAAAIVRSAHRLPAPPATEWSAPIAASTCDANSCDYPLPRNVPLDAVQIAVADVDTIGRVMVLGQPEASNTPPRHRLLPHPWHTLRLKTAPPDAHPGLPWDGIALESAYWLTQSSGAPDLHSPPVRLDGGHWRALRLETFGPISQLGHTPPTIRIGVRPRTLVFMARGAGPFEVVQAAATDTTTSMPLAQLMPARRPDDALPADSATPVAPVRSAASASAMPASAAASNVAAVSDRTPWLWAALLAGLASMGAMAWSLLRRPAQKS